MSVGILDQRICGIILNVFVFPDKISMSVVLYIGILLKIVKCKFSIGRPMSQTRYMLKCVTCNL